MKINIFNIEIKFPLFDKSNSTSISNMIEFIILLFLLHLLYFFPSYNEQQHHRTLWHKCEIKAQLIFHGIFGKTWNIWTRSFHSNSAQNHIITRHQYSRALAHLLFFLYSMFFFDVLLERNGLGLNIFLWYILAILFDWQQKKLSLCISIPKLTLELRCPVHQFPPTTQCK